MKKIISLFQRNYRGDGLVRNEVVPGAEWVLEGEGIATRKYDGTCCLIRDEVLYKRYDAKAFTVDKATGKKNEWNRKPPEGFEPAQEPDPVTGHWPGWVPVGDGPEDQWFRDGLKRPACQISGEGFPSGDWTGELIGPKVQGNPEKVQYHMIVRHGGDVLEDVPRDFEGLRAYLEHADIEGIVWHHPDGRMVKIKKKDFGFKR